MIYRLITCVVFFAVVATSSCQKEDPPPIRPPYEPPPVTFPIYLPWDTTYGAVYAKKLTAEWTANTYTNHLISGTDSLRLQFCTFTQGGARREMMILGPIDANQIGRYKIMNSNQLPPKEWILAGYSTWTSDGDVPEDGYNVDTTDMKNHLRITRIDLENKRIEGEFHVSFKMREPRHNLQNPKNVTFSEGRFWTVIRD